MGEIYLVTNIVTGKMYVGQTKYTTEARWKQHLEDAVYNRSNSYLHRSIRKYGSDNFIVKRLFHNIPEKELDSVESAWIKRLNTFVPHGYNLTRGGGGIRGFRHSEETKEVIREKSRHPLSAERIEKIKEGQRNNRAFERRSKNPNWRKNLSLARKGKFKGKDNPFGGRHHTEETKARISQSNSKPVLMYSLEGELLKRFKSLVEARDYLIENGITSNTSCQTPISKCCRCAEQRKTAYGYVWRYERCRD